jgi:hypothetical protein
VTGTHESAGRKEVLTVDLQALLASVAERMNAGFTRTAQIKHSGSKGRVREALLVGDFLRDYLPASVRVSPWAEIVAADGSVSPECDIVVFDRNTPPLVDEREYRVIPSECLYGVVEVKSRLDTKELSDAVERITAVKRLPKTAFVPFGKHANFQSIERYDRSWRFFPTFGMVFAYDSVSLEKLTTSLANLTAKIPDPAHWTDAVYVLNKGMVLHTRRGTRKIASSPSLRTELIAVASDNALVAMVIQLQDVFSTAWMPRFQIRDYLPDAEIGTVMTVAPISRPG